MNVQEFWEILMECRKNIIPLGIKKGYFKQEDQKKLENKLEEVMRKSVALNIPGTAMYGVYDYKTKKLTYNAKVFKDKKEALIYILHEMKHALDDNELSIGFELKNVENGVGMNEGATHRFATDMAEEILGEKIPETMQSSLGITLTTNLDEYQIEDKMNELFCKALGISRAEFLRMQNENDLRSLNALKQKFNEFADFEAFEQALDGIYAIQEETWFDEKGNLLEQEAEPTQAQTIRAKLLISQCQNQILQFVEKSNPERLEEIKGEMIIIDGEIMQDNELLEQADYLKYQEFITKGLDLSGYNLVFAVQSLDYDEFMRQLEESTEPFTGSIYLRQGDEYKEATVTFDKTGVIGMSEPQEMTESFEHVYDTIICDNVIGNAEETIRMLRLQGKEEEAQEIQRKYEYYMNNRDRIEIIKKTMKQRTDENAGPDLTEVNAFADMLYDDSTERDGEQTVVVASSGRIQHLSSTEDYTMSSSEPDEGNIHYKRITILSDGTAFKNTQFDQLVYTQISPEDIEMIENAVEQGDLVLTDAQKQTLLKAKQNLQVIEVGEQDFQAVALGNIAEKVEVQLILRQANRNPIRDEATKFEGE